MAAQPDKHAPPLIMRCGALGDMVILTALIQRLHLRFGQTVDIVSSGAWNTALLTGQPGVGEIFLIRSRKRPFWLDRSQHKLVKALRARGPGPAWFCDAGGAGRDLLRRGDLTDDWVIDIRDHYPDSHEHYLNQWAGLAALTPPALTAAPPPVDIPAGYTLTIKPEWRTDLDRWLATRGLPQHGWLLIQAGNKRTMRRGPRNRATNDKYWPETHWAEIARHMRATHPNKPILLLGAPQEAELNRDILALANIANAHNVADDLPITRLIALLERASGMVTVDSGPAHIAAAVGCPQVVLFGVADPQMYRPWGRDEPQTIALTGEQDGKPNMRAITVTQVIDAWNRLSLRDKTD